MCSLQNFLARIVQLHPPHMVPVVVDVAVPVVDQHFVDPYVLQPLRIPLGTKEGDAEQR